jgi:ferric-dicitrate binding protein FerR (iron transport regulator)
MAMSCGQTGRLSAASAGGHASEAERLELEAHLATCGRCSAEHAIVLSTTRALRAAEVPTLSPAARQRVWHAALSRRAHAPTVARRFGWSFAVGSAFAVAAGLAIWLGVRAPADFAVVQGDVTVTQDDVAVTQGAATAGGDAAARAVTFRTRGGGGGVVRLADASTGMSPDTEMVWRNERRIVELREGTLTVDVEHRPGQHFEVRTPRFTVEVVGTKFTVDVRGVRTERGKVRLLKPDGSEIAYLSAGFAWTAPGDAAAAQAGEPPPPPAEEPAPPHEPPPAAAGPAASANAGEAASLRLGRARRALARGNAGEARRLVEPLFRLGRDVAAEARAIYAESYLSEGRYEDAVAGYRVVVRDFPTTPQAESALYAVAQLESEHGRPGDARTTLQRYLARYPHGRFAREAADRLATSQAR